MKNHLLMGEHQLRRPRCDGESRCARMNREPVALPSAATPAHVLDHGTHHRGQVTAALTALRAASPGLDLVAMLQVEARGQ